MPELFISQLLNDEELKCVIDRTGCGLELIDFSMASVLDDLDAQLGLWQERLEVLRPPHLSVHGAFLDLNPTSWERFVADATMLRFNQSYQAAKVLGAERVTYHSCFVPNFNFLEGWAPRVIDFYERFLEDKDDSIHILMENVMDPVPEAFAEVAEGISHPAFGICLDIGHAHCYSDVPVRKWLEDLAPWIRHLHIHDNDGKRDSHLALGDGTIGFEEMAGLVPKDAAFTVECSRKDYVMQSIQNLQEWL